MLTARISFRVWESKATGPEAQALIIRELARREKAMSLTWDLLTAEEVFHAYAARG